MKKILAIALMCILTLAVAGMAMAETWTMATNVGFPPYEFYDDTTGEPTGIDVCIFKELCARMGVEGEVVDMDFSAVIPGVATGKFTMGLGAITVTEERKQSVDFSINYASGIQAIIVAEGSEITTVDDLYVEGKNYAIGVQEGTTGDIYVSGDFEDSGLASVERFKNVADAVVALSAGKLDCIIVDNGPAQASVAANEGLKVLETEYSNEDYAIVLPKDSDLTASVDEVLQGMIDDGTVQAIVDQFIK